MNNQEPNKNSKHPLIFCLIHGLGDLNLPLGLDHIVMYGLRYNLLKNKFWFDGAERRDNEWCR